jgi:uncharacterized membrane protein
MKFLKQYVSTALVFVGIDLLWIGGLMLNFYTNAYGDLARTVDGKFQAAIIPGILVYLIIPLGIVMLGFRGATTRRQAVAQSAMYGFFAYATYDLTALSVLRDWSVLGTIVDIAWGTTLATIVALLTWRRVQK